MRNNNRRRPGGAARTRDTAIFSEWRAAARRRRGERAGQSHALPSHAQDRRPAPGPGMVIAIIIVRQPDAEAKLAVREAIGPQQ